MFILSVSWFGVCPWQAAGVADEATKHGLVLCGVVPQVLYVRRLKLSACHRAAASLFVPCDLLHRLAAHLPRSTRQKGGLISTMFTHHSIGNHTCAQSLYAWSAALRVQQTGGGNRRLPHVQREKPLHQGIVGSRSALTMMSSSE